MTSGQPMNDQVQPEAPKVSVRVNNGGEHFTPVGNVQVASAPEGSILSTVRSPSGSRQVGEITEDSRVTIGGVEMTISQARQHGLVSLQDGQLTELDRPVPVEPEAGPDDSLEIDGEVVDTLANWNEAIQGYTGSGQATYEVVSQFMNDPDTLPPLLETMAQENNQDPGVFHEEAKKIASTIEAALHDRVRSVGIDPGAFGDFIRNSAKADDFNRAIMQVIIGGDMGPLNGLIDHYRRYAPTQDDADASVSVEVHGQKIETTVANAKRNGWL